MTEYIYIMDYSESNIVEAEITPERDKILEEGTERLLKELGFDPDECSWFFTTKRVYHIKKI